MLTLVLVLFFLADVLVLRLGEDFIGVQTNLKKHTFIQFMRKTRPEKKM